MYKAGEIVTGYVTGIKNYGIFVHLDEKASGLVHISQISEKFVKNVNNFAELGEVIRVQILKEERENHYQLSIKGIDYRIMRQRGSKIQETSSGFKNLAILLEKWMKEKEEEFKNEQK